MQLRTRFMLALVLLISLPNLSQAREWFRSGEISVDIIGDHGGIFPQYSVERNDRLYRAYLEARQGEEYGIRVYNNSPYRVGLVIAVDGRNIISGDRSDLQAGERMYILAPHESAVYDGWRTAQNQVNRFYFTDAGNSYAAAWGDTSAMGVIAVAAFKELRPVYEDYRNRDFGMNSDKRAAPSIETVPGTGYGEEQYSPSQRVHFVAENVPLSRIFYKYEWREQLCRRGVARCYDTYQVEPYNRMWRDDGEDHYAPPPPRYRPD